MLTRSWTCAEHEDFGGMGWKPDWQPDFDPLGGMAVAHDIMEHFPDDDGGLAGELQAFGAMYLVRVQSSHHDKWGKKFSDDNMHNEIADHVRRVRWGDTDPLPDHCFIGCDPETSHAINKMVASARAVYNEEQDYQGSAWGDADVMSPLDCLSYAAWIKQGYMRAKHRFAELSTDDLAFMFEEIAAFANRHLKSAEPGARITVTVRDDDYVVDLEHMDQWEVWAEENPDWDQDQAA